MMIRKEGESYSSLMSFRMEDAPYKARKVSKLAGETWSMWIAYGSNWWLERW